MTRIEAITALEILNSRGNPTLECVVTLNDGSAGRARVPSGASTGVHEAVELRDGDPARFGGKGVLTAVANVEAVIGPELIGFDVTGPGRARREAVRARRHAEQGQARRQRDPRSEPRVEPRGGCGRAGVPLYRHLGGDGAHVLPVPQFNVLNGGAHAQTRVDFQEFMFLPIGLPTFREALRAGAECFHALRTILHDRGLGTGQGDEGGYAPDLDHNEAAMELLMEAIGAAGYAPGRRCRRSALDPATSELYQNGRYELRGEGITARPRGPGRPLGGLVRQVPDRVPRGRHGRGRLGRLEAADRSPRRARPAGGGRHLRHQRRPPPARHRPRRRQLRSSSSSTRSAPSPRRSQPSHSRTAHNYTSVISHRSGETEDTSIADLAVAVNAGQIKTGRAVAVGAGCQVQPPAADRARARRGRPLRGSGAVPPNRAPAGLTMTRRVDPSTSTARAGLGRGDDRPTASTWSLR